MLSNRLMSSIRNMSVYVVGVSMTPFCKPARPKPTYVDLGRRAIDEALQDCGLNPSSVDAVVASYNYGDPVCGHRVCLEAGIEDVPIYNVNAYCSSGSVGLNLARKLVLSGEHQCVLAVGFDQMEHSLVTKWEDRVSSVQLHTDKLTKLGVDPRPLREGMNAFTSDVIKMFAMASREYMEKYPETPQDIFAQIALINRTQGTLNPRAVLAAKPFPQRAEEMHSRPLMPPISAEMAAPFASGAAAAVLVGRDWLQQKGSPAHRKRAVEIVAQAAVTDNQNVFDSPSFIDLIGVGHAKTAAERVFAASGTRPSEVDVVELHDCFSANQLFVLEALGFAERGQGARLVKHGEWEELASGGRQFRFASDGGGIVVNPSGGLESKGHPIGATGLAQCFELVSQLRNEAGKRQVPGAKLALQHNFGLGSTCVVTMYRAPLQSARL